MQDLEPEFFYKSLLSFIQLREVKEFSRFDYQQSEEFFHGLRDHIQQQLMEQKREESYKRNLIASLENYAQQHQSVQKESQDCTAYDLPLQKSQFQDSSCQADDLSREFKRKVKSAKKRKTLSQSGTRKSAQKVLTKPPSTRTRQDSTNCTSNYCAGMTTKRGNSESKKLAKTKKSKENGKSKEKEIKKLEKRVDTLSTNIAKL